MTAAAVPDGEVPPEALPPLPRAFYARDATEVAPDLLGKLLVRADEGLVARIVETEAYMSHEPAAHSFRGPTPGNAVLFGPPGHAYVYFTYGMHWCANTVTGSDGDGQGVLLRAAEPLAGLPVMRQRRTGRTGRPPADAQLLNGPAKLAQAFGLDGAWRGVDLTGGSPLRIVDDGWRPQGITTGPRVGVAAAAEVPWRFTVTGSPWVSRYVRHPRA